MLKDHLGNVRMVLTDEVKTNFYPAATLETATIAAESNIYSNLTATQTSKPGWFSDPLYPTNNMVARLRNAGGYQKVGPNILLKVMAGDKFNIRVASGWSGTSPTNSQASVYADLFSSVTIGLAAHSAGKATAAALQSPAVGIGSALTTFLNSQPAATNTPKAYLAWLLFDEQFKLVSTGAQQVGASGATTLHVVNGQLVTKSGYLYVYTSNEATNMDVFFDNLQVTHIQGALLEETHYYPFGLVMSGISSKAAGLIQNKEKTFQGQRFDDDLGLNWVQFKWRNHDPQIGRFIEIDPLSEKYVYNSTYAFSENKVTGHVELEGLEAAPTEDKRPYPARVPAANTIGNVAKGFVFGLNGQYQTEPVRGSTVTGIRDTKAGGTNAAGKTKGMDVVRVDEPHGKVTTPHLNINPKATGLPSDPHTPLTPTQFNGLKTAGQVLDGIDRIAKPVAIVTDAIQLGNAIKTDIQQGTGGDNTIVTGSRVAGGWAGAWGGAQGGAAIGAGIGSFFGPGPFTAVGGFIGGIIGGIGGAIFGSKVGEAAGEKVVEIKNGN
jgi:RHS repeat-associated protein